MKIRNFCNLETFKNPRHDDELAEKEKEADDIVEDDHAYDISHEKVESIFGWDTEVGGRDGAHNVSVAAVMIIIIINYIMII